MTAMDYSAISSDALLMACLRSGDELAWTEFVRRFQPLIATVALRIARRWGESSPEVVDDLVQETFLKLCADRGLLLERFRPGHPDAIFGYIKVLTANLVHDHFKALNSQKRGRNVTSALSQDNETSESRAPSVSEAKAMERSILIGQIDVTLRTLEVGPHVERDRRIFWLYYRIGLSARAIAAIPGIGITTKGVESTLLRLTRHVKQKLSHPRQESLGSAQDDKGIRPAESF
jgi:RNA polymerase sigma-70 factor (ECF subfamily)